MEWKQSFRVFWWALALLVTLPHLALGQSAGKIPRIGLLTWSSCEGPPSVPGLGEFEPFVRALGDLGYKPGETVTIECRAGGRRYDGLATAAAELARIPVDIIVGSSEPAGHAAHKATDAIPIVTILSGDPVASGLARTIAKPGGNVTGVSYYATELTAKRLELLKEMLPEVATIDVLANPDVAYLPFEEDAKRAAAQIGVTVRIHHARELAEIKTAFFEMQAVSAQAVFVLPDVVLAWEAERIAALALEQRLPTMAWGSWYAEVGCLMAYSAQYEQMDYRLASYVDRILKGANAGDLPIEQPTTFELWINLKTAKALGIDVPQALLLRADKVIE